MYIVIDYHAAAAFKSADVFFFFFLFIKWKLERSKWFVLQKNMSLSYLHLLWFCKQQQGILKRKKGTNLNSEIWTETQDFPEWFIV